MSSWGLLDEKEENELHKHRLLNVEEKPFKRIAKRLRTLHSLASSRARQLPTPPLENNANGAGEDAPSPVALSDATSDIVQLKEDMLLDFAVFTNNIVRLQLQLTANEEQRTQYAVERGRILETSQRVRDDTAQLHVQLAQARETLEQRKKFDELADRITSNRNLRSRAEQANNLEKLEEEIAQLEAESETYVVTWRERRDQFSRIMDESMRLRRQIRDEKEEVERREGMDDEGTAGGGDAEDHPTPRQGIASGNATPRPDGHLLVKSGLENGERAGTPLLASTAGGRTPARDSPAPGSESQSFSLKPGPDTAGSSLENGNRLGSREPSLNPVISGEGDKPVQEGEDVEMDEPKNDADMLPVKQEGEPEDADSPLTPLPAEDTPRIVVDGEEVEGDKMDTT